MANSKFRAGIAIPPGVTLQEILDDRNITQKELATRLDVTPKHVNKIINGTASISPEVALKLEFVLGIPAGFWNKLEMNYQETKARLEAIPQVEEEFSILKQIPYNEIAKLGWVTQTKDLREKVNNLRAFFRIASLETLPLVQGVALRKSLAFETNKYALAAWMNQAEIKASEVETNPFNLTRIKNILPNLRKLTKRPLKASKIELVDLCASVGIALVFIPNIESTYVNGATKWMPSKVPMIAMSTRGAYEDIFWFTFFHEIGHVLQEDKSATFIDEDEIEINDLESEANKFSTNILIPEELFKDYILNSNFMSVVEIRNFSEKIDVHIGIIIGRLLHENLIAYDSPQYKTFEKLRRKYKLYS